MEYILVTGASGFIGSRLVSKLESIGLNIIKADSSVGDIVEFNFIEEYKTYTIKHIFHLAAMTFVPDSWENPVDFYKTSVIGTGNVLELCRNKNIPLTFVSSYLYGKPKSLPILENSDVKSNNPYAHSKYLAEELCKFYSEYYDVKVTIARPFNIYGKDQKEIFLIPHIINQVLNKNEIKVKDLNPKRDYLYLDDLVDGLVKTMNSKSLFTIYNFGSGYSLSVKEIIDMVQDICNTNKEIISEDKERRDEILDVVADISKAKKELNWMPNTSFADGIKKIVKELKDA